MEFFAEAVPIHRGFITQAVFVLPAIGDNDVVLVTGHDEGAAIATINVNDNDTASFAKFGSMM